MSSALKLCHFGRAGSLDLSNKPVRSVTTRGPRAVSARRKPLVPTVGRRSVQLLIDRIDHVAWKHQGGMEEIGWVEEKPSARKGGAEEKKEAGDSPPAGLSRGKSLKERMAMFGN